MDADPFGLSPAYAYKPRTLKVFTIGAGFSGLLMAHKFQHRFPDLRDIVQHTIFEARSEVGGTWLANHYPGVQCDVPAHIYVRITSPESQVPGCHVDWLPRPFPSTRIQTGHAFTPAVPKSWST